MAATIKNYPPKTDFGDLDLTNVGSVALDEITSDSDTSVTVTLGTDAGDNFIVATDALVVLGETAKRGYVGVGTASPDGALHVMKASAGSVTASGDGNALVVENSDVAGMSLLSPGDGVIYFGDVADNDIGRIVYKHSDDSMNIWTNNAARLTIDSSGNATSTGVVTATGFTIGSAAITETELEILDGATLSTTELNYVDGVSSAIQTQLDGKSPTAGHSSIATVGTVGTGTWQGTVVASAYLDGDTAHLTTTQTFSGAKTFSAASTHAGVSLSEATSLSISAPALATTDHTAAGVTAVMLAGAAIAAFEVVCISTTSGKIVKTDANAIGTMPVVGIATEAFSGDNETGTVLLQGFIRDDTWNWVPGSILYASETAGAMTHTAPTTSGAFVQALGVALTADVVKFMPSLTLVEVA